MTDFAREAYKDLVAKTVHLGLTERRVIFSELHNYITGVINRIDKEIDAQIVQCIPPAEYRVHSHHWLRDSQGELLIGKFSNNEWELVGTDYTYSPKEAGEYGYEYYTPIGTPSVEKDDD